MGPGARAMTMVLISKATVRGFSAIIVQTGTGQVFNNVYHVMKLIIL